MDSASIDAKRNVKQVAPRKEAAEHLTSKQFTVAKLFPLGFEAVPEYVRRYLEVERIKLHMGINDAVMPPLPSPASRKGSGCASGSGAYPHE